MSRRVHLILIGSLILLRPTPAAAQERWLVIYRQGSMSYKIDSTRIIGLAPNVYRFWRRNLTDNLALEDLDCGRLRSRIVQEESTGPSGSRIVSPNPDTTFGELAPETTGEAVARAACLFFATWSRSKSRTPQR